MADSMFRNLIVADGRRGSMVKAANDVLDRWGVDLRDWQVEPWEELWAVDGNGHLLYSPASVLLTAPRQTGKTHLVMLWVLVFLTLFSESTEVLWSSHHGTTTTATLRDLIDMCDEYKVPHKASESVGREELWIGPRSDIKKGAHIRFGSRERGLGRGLHGIDIIVADEYQKSTPKFLETALAAMNNSSSPVGSLLFKIGTAPEAGAESETFLRDYRKAIPEGLPEYAGRTVGAGGTLVIDLGATNDLRDDPAADIYAPEVIAQANPEYGVSVGPAIFARAREELSRAGFLREYLNVFTHTGILSEEGVLFGNPLKYALDYLQLGAILAFGAGVAPDEGDVVLAGVSVDPLTGKEFVATMGRWGSVTSAAPEIARIQAEHGATLQLDGEGPASALAEALGSVGVWANDERGDMLRGLRDELRTGALAILPSDEALIDSMRSATPRTREKGGAQLSRRRGEPAAVEAAMMALDAARQGAGGGQEFW